ncbi:MAG: UDP-N-acetylmuramate dehydrogenase [Bacteroidales bacterium]|nr:UDP-N-acetylmuramate dehydrogenase [Bacteroidales bacterium]
MKKFKNLSLKNFHTFRTDIVSNNLYVIENDEDILQLFNNGIFGDDYYILGSGSNVLFLRIPTHIIIISTKGKTIINENEDYVWINVKAGEIWDEFVTFCIANNWGGVENLSYIPGTVGACPIQNIGAYGVEVKDVIESVWALNLLSGEKKEFSNNDCCFAYRNSYFKIYNNEKWLITDVLFKLTKRNHKYNLSYGNLKKEFENEKIDLENIRKKIILQRLSKLPDPKVLGNAGSFFKNPILEKNKFHTLQQQYPDIPYFEYDYHHVKIPAAWLIEKAGMKGYRIGNVGTHEHQPLVIVNYNNATPYEIYEFSEKIIKEVNNCFNIRLEREVNIIS